MIAPAAARPSSRVPQAPRPRQAPPRGPRILPAAGEELFSEGCPEGERDREAVFWLGRRVAAALRHEAPRLATQGLDVPAMLARLDADLAAAEREHYAESPPATRPRR